jgi:hypothetical protein
MIIRVLITPSDRFIVAITVVSAPEAGAFKEKDFLPVPDKTFWPLTDQEIETLFKLST